MLAMTPEVVGRIGTIAYTPVKSTSMVELTEARLTPEGLYDGDVGDRTWMVVYADPDQNGVYHVAAQRDEGMGIMVLIQPQVTQDALRLTWKGNDPFAVPRDRNNGREIKVEIWKEVVGHAIDQGPEVAEWLSDYLGRQVLLVKATEESLRKVSQKYTANEAILRLWQDSYPINWIPQESIDELSRRAGRTFDWRRLRPNIVVVGVPIPDFEHTVLRGQFGIVPFKNGKPCDRCGIPQVNPDTGEVDAKGPNGLLNTLRTYKNWLKPSGDTVPILGEGALIEGEGEIAVGQDVTVFEYRSQDQRPVYGGIDIKSSKKDN